ncbi:MAG: Asp-tRNA(Asn)/Glu-tRNA(Gln) amidotransferase subunit GatA [Nitrospinae bacterium]|nr:Asp-tRNA(Asn)/Glu-tRNA(Gln) amidotransferase subunit GatA [Nitrospinota bacterium]
MAHLNLHQLTIHQLAGLLRSGECTSTQIVESVLQRIEAVEGKTNSYLSVFHDEALRQAEAADQVFKREKNPHILAGIPIAIKDLISLKGEKNTCASNILRNYISPFDSTAVRRLREAGTVFIGKTNLDEFAMGSSNENSCFGPAKNPWDLGRVTGGSSGGSAAAVAADECIGSLGTDTGGSIRQPASFCGVVGLKPTYGRVSRFGLVAFASSLDQIGPMAKDVKDAAIMLNCISGKDPMDSTSADVQAPDFTKSLAGDVRGLRIGAPIEYFAEGLDPEVEKAVKDGMERLKALGAEITDISLPHTSYALPVYYILSSAEASSNLARYDGVKYGYRSGEEEGLRKMYERTRKEGFGPEVKRRIMLGTYVLSSGYYDAYYIKAQKVRTLIRGDFDDAFKKCDVIISPVVPAPAFKLGEKMEDPLTMYLSDIYTMPVNLAGLPALSVPCGFNSSGLPMGMQLIGRRFDEETILRAAYAFETTTDFHKKKPLL